MKAFKALLALACASIFLSAGPALAQTSYVVIDGTKVPINFAAVFSGGQYHPKHVMEGLVSGVPTGVTMSGASGAIDVNITGTPSFTCSGCSGGSGGAVTAAASSYAAGALAQLPSVLGVTTKAASLSVALASDQTLPDTSAGDLAATHAALGAPGDPTCTTDAGTCGLLALVKRLDAAITTLNGKIDTLNTSATTSATALSDTTTPSPVKFDQTSTNNQVQVAASEAHKGEVGGNQITVQVTPTTTAVAFTSGWAVGGLQTIANAGRVTGGTGLLQSVSVFLKATQTSANAAMDIFLFADTTLSSTCTNGAAFVLSSADWAKLVGVIHVTDTTAGNTTTVVQALNQARPYHTAATSLYACAVTRGTPTWGSTDAATFAYDFIRN